MSELSEAIGALRETTGALKDMILVHGDMVSKQEHLAALVVGHQRTLYGEDGRNGIVGDVSVLKTNQEQCPARQAAQLPNKQSAFSNWVAVGALVVAALAFLISIFQGRAPMPG